jgi:hypothetical protein
MSLQRFLDWFEGFAENVGEAPTAEQWTRIREKIGVLSANGEVNSALPVNTESGFTHEKQVEASKALASLDQQAADQQIAIEREDARRLRSLQAAVIGQMMMARPDVPPDIIERTAGTHVTTDDIGKEPEVIAAALEGHLT